MKKNVQDEIELTIKGNYEVFGGIRIEVRNGKNKGKDKLAVCWLNLNFLDQTAVIRLLKPELDKAFKDTRNLETGPDFFVELHFIEKNENIDNIIEKALSNVKHVPSFNNF